MVQYLTSTNRFGRRFIDLELRSAQLFCLPFLPQVTSDPSLYLFNYSFHWTHSLQELKPKKMIVTNMVAIAVGLGAITALLVVALSAFQLLFVYEITSKHIIVRLFHAIPVYKIPLENIKRVSLSSALRVAFVPGMHLFTRPFSQRVVIEISDAWARFAFLTPEDPDAFISDIKRKRPDLNESAVTGGASK